MAILTLDSELRGHHECALFIAAESVHRLSLFDVRSDSIAFWMGRTELPRMAVEGKREPSVDGQVSIAIRKSTLKL